MADEQNQNPNVEANASSQTGAVTAEELLAFRDIRLSVTVVLGKARMTVSQFLKLSRGAVVELDRLKTDNLDVEVNGYPVARGEVTIVEDRIGLTIKEL